MFGIVEQEAAAAQLRFLGWLGWTLALFAGLGMLVVIRVSAQSGEDMPGWWVFASSALLCLLCLLFLFLPLAKVHVWWSAPLAIALCFASDKGGPGFLRRPVRWLGWQYSRLVLLGSHRRLPKPD